MANRKSVVDFEIRGANGLTTIKQLEDRVKTLRKEWRNTEDAASRALKVDELKAANAEMQRHTSIVKGVGGAWSDFKKNFLSIASGVLGGNLITVAAQFLIGIIPGLISKAGKLSDSLADVRKTTGMTRAEVEGLNSDLKKMDTRTSREELRKLASEAGKLGKESTEDVLAFVSAADKITVALGEDLGADAVTKIGKITQTFDLEKLYGTEQAMLKVGSAVNSIGAASNANEKNIVEFTYRTQGLASAAGIAVGDILGYAATLDMAGQSMEVGATVTNKLFVALGTDVPKFAKLAKMGVQDFAKLLQTDANEALIRVLENVKGNNKGLLGMAEILKKLGLEGQESVNVVSALANNTETLRQQQELGNEEVRKGTSILEEFNIKNNTTAAILEKISHWWNSLTSFGSGGWVDDMIRGFAKMIGVLTDTDETLGEISEKFKEISKNESKLQPLIKRYNELNSITNKTNQEHLEMKKLISDIGAIVPQAATAWDSYGKIAAISLQKVNDMLAAQKKDLMKMTEVGLEEENDKIPKLREKVNSLKNDLKNKKTIKMGFGGLPSYETATSEDIAKMQAELNLEGDNLKKSELLQKNYRRNLRHWNDMFKTKSSFSDTKTNVDTPPIKLGDGNLGNTSDKAKQAAEKEIEEQKRLKDELRKIRNKMEVEQLHDKEKELKQNELHYAELRIKAKNNAENLVEIDAQEKAEKGLIEAKYEAKLNESLAKVYEEKRRESMNDAELEIVTAMDKYEKLLELAGDNEAKITEIVRLEAEEIYAIRKKYAKTDVIGESLIELDRLRNEAGLGLDGQVMAGAIDPQAANIRKLEIEQEYLTASYMLYALAGQDRLDLAEQWMANEQEIDFKRAEFSKRIDEELKQSTYALADAKRESLMNGLSILKGFFKQSSGIYKALFLAEKAVAIAQVVVSGIRERSSLRLAEAGLMAGASLLGPLAPGAILSIKAATAAQIQTSRIRTFSSIAGIAATAFQEIAMKATGGYTDIDTMYGSPKGFVNSPTMFNLGRRSFIAGEAGQEFVISNAALRNPVVADFSRMLDVMQKTGDYSQLSAGGGDSEKLTGHLIGLRSDIQRMNSLLGRTANRPVVFEYQKFEDFQDYIFEIRDSVSA